mmetsp:Transcript_22785/g.38022  ORF Transcript_22785/g.38022 Transcript_22785/m.38022 type:complete len:469 (-) Transcript_22785:381-1787(-)
MAVPTLVTICQQKIIKILEDNEFHGRLVNDLCKHVPDALLEPIFNVLLERGAVTDVALLAFLVPGRMSLRVRQALKIRNSIFKQIGLNCPNLMTLDLSDCSQIRNSVVRTILQGCPILEDIRLDRCHRLTDSAFEFAESPFQSLLGCFSLEAISLQGCPQITGEIISTLNKHCRSLQYLNLSQCKNVRSPEIQEVFQHNRLRSLNLAFIDDISDEAFILLPPALVSNSSTSTIASRSGSQISSTSSGTSRDLYNYCCPLQKLNVCKSRITDSSIFRMANNLIALIEIRLQWCTGVSDAGITALVRSCPRLRLLDLKSCAVTDRGILSIAENCAQLKELDLSWCPNFSESALIRLLEMHNSGRIDSNEEGLEASVGLTLEQLNLEWCAQVTDATLHALKAIEMRQPSGSSLLKCVRLSGCVNITHKGLEMLRAHEPPQRQLQHPQALIEQYPRNNKRTIGEGRINVVSS